MDFLAQNVYSFIIFAQQLREPSQLLPGLGNM